MAGWRWKSLNRNPWWREVLESISRPDGEKAKIVLPLETFKAWIDYPDALGFGDLRDKLRAASAEIELPTATPDLWRDQLQKYAPAEIKNSPLEVEPAYKLWQSVRTCEEDGVKSEIVKEALRQTLLQVGPNFKPPDELFDYIVRELKGDAAIEAEITELGDKSQMLESVKKYLIEAAQWHDQMAAAFGAPGIKRRSKMITKAMQPMLDRLALLQEPELALIAAILTKKDYLKIWATANGWKFGEGAPAPEAEK